MVIDKRWYATAFEHSSNVTITFNPYDIDPMPNSGGAITVSGQYDIPGEPAKLTQVYYEMTHLVGNSPYFQPVPPAWWSRGVWDDASMPLLFGDSTTHIDPDEDDAAIDAWMRILTAREPEAIMSGSLVYNKNGALTSAAVIWEDGVTGTYTALALSTAFPGAVDSYKVTYNGSPVQTYTQPTVTRDVRGVLTVVPAIVVT